MQRAKVLHLITHLGVGGGLDNTLLTVRDLSRARYEVHLAAGELMPEDGYRDWVARSRECSDALFVFPDLRRPAHIPSDLRALRKLTDFIKEQDYQIVHTHCAKAGFIGRIAARRAGVPVIVHTYHAFPWKVAHAFESSALRRLKSAVKRRLYIRMERYVASRSDALITVADLNRQEATGLELAPAEKFTTIHSAIEVGRFRTLRDRDEIRRSLGLDLDLPVVGLVGRLSVQKAPLDFVKAAKRVLERRPDARFLIVGDGPLTGEVERAIGEDPAFRLLGFREDMPELFSAMDVFALSSVWEGLGRAMTEAMIAGVPVAVTAVDGVPELVRHGQTGLLSAASDPAALAENILRLLEHPDQARAMSRRARQFVTPMFGVERMVDRIDSLYERLLSSKGRPFTVTPKSA